MRDLTYIVRHRLSRQPGLAPSPIVPVHRPIRDPGRRPGHSAPRAKTALVHSVSTEISTETAPHSRLVFQNAAQVSNEATVASVTALQFALQSPQDRLQPSRVTVAAVALPAATKARPPQGVAARLEHSWVSCSTQLRVAAPAFLAARL